MFLDSFDTSIQPKNDLVDIITGPDEDLDVLLFHTVDAQIKVTTNKNSSASSHSKSTRSQQIRLQSDSTEFGDNTIKIESCFISENNKYYASFQLNTHGKWPF